MEGKNPAAQELGRLRMAKLTPKQRSAHGKKAYAAIPDKEHARLARKGGKALWANMTPEQRSAEMKRRAKVRAKNRKKGK